MNSIIGLDVYAQFQPLERKIIRPSQSATAISVMEALQTVLTGKEIRKFSYKIEEEFSKDFGHSRFDPYSTIEKKYLSNKTDEELKEIKEIKKVVYIE